MFHKCENHYTNLMKLFIDLCLNLKFNAYLLNFQIFLDAFEKNSFTIEM